MGFITYALYRLTVMSETITHHDRSAQKNELIVRTFPANGSRYKYVFNTETKQLDTKTKTTNPATSEEQKRTVAPTVTPRVKEYLNAEGYDWV